MSENMYIARSTDKSVPDVVPSGGAVTSILKCALESGLIEGVVAVKARSDDRFSGIPVLISKPDELAGSAGSLHASIPNIARFVKEYLDGASSMKLAVVGKPCDIRAIIELQKRQQIERESLFLVGLNCSGIVSPAEARRIFREELKVDPKDVVLEDIDEGRLTVFLKDGKSKSIDLGKLEEKGGGRRDNCRRCTTKIPTFADLACGKWGTEEEEEGATFIEVSSEKGRKLLDNAVDKGCIETKKPSKAAIELRSKREEEETQLSEEWRARDFKPIMEMSLEERFEYWKHEFDKCIKCYGCRDACPICYCEDCLLEADREFLEAGVIPPSALFPLTRLAHTADSCVGCGQCQDACPMDLPLSKMFTLLSSRLSDVFEYVPGVDIEQGPPLSNAMTREIQIDDTFLDIEAIMKKERGASKSG
jgi:formate dehydrogenase subunit beta